MSKCKPKSDVQILETETKWQNFLKVLAEGPPNIKKACDATGMHRSILYGWLKTNPDKKAEFDVALKLGQEAFRDHGYELAEKNHIVYMFMMKALFPEYRDKVDGNFKIDLFTGIDIEKLINIAKRGCDSSGSDSSKK